MKILAYLSGIIVVISIILAVVDRLFVVDKALSGMGALLYLRITNTLSLSTIVFLILGHVERNEREVQ